MGKPPNLYAYPDISELAESLRSYILDAQNIALERHSVFRVAVSGGSLPKILARTLLSPDVDSLDFSKWEIFFADERAVQLEHPDSNFRSLKTALLDKVPASMAKPAVFPIDTRYLQNVQELASEYAQTLVRAFAARDSVKIPMFDLILLGCGLDGHTCSLFPGHDLLRETQAWVAAIEDSPKPPSKRITLSLPVATHGIRIAFISTGKDKSDIIRKIFDTEEGHNLPCGLVNSMAQERVTWFTDYQAVEGVQFPVRRSSL